MFSTLLGGFLSQMAAKVYHQPCSEEAFWAQFETSAKVYGCFAWEECFPKNLLMIPIKTITITNNNNKNNNRQLTIATTICLIYSSCKTNWQDLSKKVTSKPPGGPDLFSRAALVKYFWQLLNNHWKAALLKKHILYWQFFKHAHSHCSTIRWLSWSRPHYKPFGWGEGVLCHLSR